MIMNDEYVIFCLVGLVLLQYIIEPIIRGFDKRAITYNSYITKVIVYTAMADLIFINTFWDANDVKLSALLIGISCGLSLIIALWWNARKRTFKVYGIQKNRLEALIMEQLDQSGIIHTLVKKAGVGSRIYIDGSKMFIKLKSIVDISVMSMVQLTFYNFYNTENFKKVKDSIFDKIEEVSAKKMGGKSELVVIAVTVCLVLIVVWVVLRNKM